MSEHTVKEDKFVNKMLYNDELKVMENKILVEEFIKCRKSVGGQDRIKTMLGLIDCPEKVDWIDTKTKKHNL